MYPGALGNKLFRNLTTRPMLSSVLHKSSYVDCDEVEPGLYLGNIGSATDEKFLKENKITHVLTAFIYPVVNSDDVTTMFVDVEDSEDANILDCFEEAYKFIEDGRRNGHCLVHCYAGLSRSASIVIAYLMKKYGIGLKEATMRVRDKRYLAYPNPGFEKQLRLYKTMGCKLDKEYVGYRLFQMELLANKVKFEKDFDATSYAASRESVVSGDRFKCKTCRKYLFSEANIFPHELIPSGRSTLSSCNASYFVEVLPWMESAFKQSVGKILCKHCQSKLGSFVWDTEDCATCGVSICPCFSITRSNVDREKTS